MDASDLAHLTPGDAALIAELRAARRADTPQLISLPSPVKGSSQTRGRAAAVALGLAVVGVTGFLFARHGWVVNPHRPSALENAVPDAPAVAPVSAPLEDVLVDPAPPGFVETRNGPMSKEEFAAASGDPSASRDLDQLPSWDAYVKVAASVSEKSFVGIVAIRLPSDVAANLFANAATQGAVDHGAQRFRVDGIWNASGAVMTEKNPPRHLTVVNFARGSVAFSIAAGSVGSAGFDAKGVVTVLADRQWAAAASLDREVQEPGPSLWSDGGARVPPKPVWIVLGFILMTGALGGGLLQLRELLKPAA